VTTWLNAAEAAAYLRVSHRTVLLWAKRGTIPAHRLSGAQRVTWRFRADELDAFMNGETN
jgi:excisionase family DNA binding protein